MTKGETPEAPAGPKGHRGDQEIALLQFAMDRVGEAVFLIDEKARFHYVNEESCRSLGYTREELLGLGSQDIDPDFLTSPEPALWSQRWDDLRAGRSIRFETRHRRKDGSLFPVEVSSSYFEYGKVAYLLALARDISERKQAEQQRLAHLRFVESMDRINQAIQGTDDIEQVMRDVLDAVLSIFACDRAFLLYPCDPEAASWQVPMERCRPEYGGIFPIGQEVPMDPEVAEGCRALLEVDGPLTAGPQTHPLAAEVSERFGLKSLMSMAIRPTSGKAWQFGVHQCSHARIWTPDEEKLLQEIGRRLGDALSTLLAHRALREHERQLRTLIDNLPDGIARFDKDRRHLFVSPAVTKARGLPAEQMIGKTPHEVGRPGNESQNLAVEGLIKRAFEEGVPNLTEAQWVTPQGIRHFDLLHIPERDEAGNVGSVLGISHDITERKQAENALRRLNRELRAVSSCNQTLMRATDEQILLDEICRIVCDEAGYRMAWVGYVEHDQDKTVRPVAWAGAEAGYVPAANITWAETERGRGPGGMSVRQGKSVCIQDIATDPRMAPWRDAALLRGYRSTISMPLKNEKATVFGILGIFSPEANAFTPDEIRLLEQLAADLAFGIMVVRARQERDRAEKLLALRSFALDNVHEAAFLSDEHGCFLDVNEEACRVLGYTRSELLGMGVPDIDPDLSEERLLVNWKILEQRHVVNAEGRHRAKGGRVFPVDISANYFEYGGRAYTLTLVRDITEHKRAEEEQAQLRQHLQRAQKMEAVGQLAGGIAHDFNNILAVVNGYSEIILRNPKIDEAIRSRVQEILNAGNRAASLTGQLLAFSRKQVLQPKVLSLNQVVEDMQKMLGRIIGEDIEMRFVLDPGLKPAMADRSQMEQVLLNLSINARDAMPDGGVLTIETANVEFDAIQAAQHFPLKPGPHIRLAVSDTGIGMEAEILAHMFEPFFTTKGPDKGTGLGLATVYGIVAQSGGQMSVDSKPGRGSTFSLYLPVVLERATSYQREIGSPQPRRGHETILLVEDVASLRALIKEFLEENGYTVLAAENGEQALQIAQQHGEGIALLLTDVVLPKIKGPSLAGSLLQRNPRMKVLYMSGHPDHPLVDDEVQAQGAAFLQKPFSVADLTKKIRELLDKAGDQESRTRPPGQSTA
jgi:PAS domain S-box-containing protein